MTDERELGRELKRKVDARLRQLALNGYWLCLHCMAIDDWPTDPPLRKCNCCGSERVVRRPPCA